MAKQLSFEEAFSELEATVKKLEQGGLTLEESTRLFQRGVELVKRCHKLLDEAELKIKVLLPSATGHELKDYSEDSA